MSSECVAPLHLRCVHVYAIHTNESTVYSVYSLRHRISWVWNFCAAAVIFSISDGYLKSLNKCDSGNYKIRSGQSFSVKCDSSQSVHEPMLLSKNIKILISKNGIEWSCWAQNCLPILFTELCIIFKFEFSSMNWIKYFHFFNSNL